MKVMGQICGRDYQRIPMRYIHERDAIKNRHNYGSKIIGDGLLKADGTHIRFRSYDSAKRHIKNFRLELASRSASLNPRNQAQ